MKLNLLLIALFAMKMVQADHLTTVTVTPSSSNTETNTAPAVSVTPVVVPVCSLHTDKDKSKHKRWKGKEGAEHKKRTYLRKETDHKKRTNHKEGNKNWKGKENKAYNGIPNHRNGDKTKNKIISTPSAASNPVCKRN